VWDFSRESYVNRLIQNEVDGKLVEVGEGAEGEEKDISSVFHFNKKVETLNHEYNLILRNTLEEQRKFYQLEIDKAAQEKLRPLEKAKACLKEEQDLLAQVEKEIETKLEQKQAEEQELEALRSEF